MRPLKFAWFGQLLHVRAIMACSLGYSLPCFLPLSTPSTPVFPFSCAGAESAIRAVADARIRRPRLEVGVDEFGYMSVSIPVDSIARRFSNDRITFVIIFCVKGARIRSLNSRLRKRNARVDM